MLGLRNFVNMDRAPHAVTSSSCLFNYYFRLVHTTVADFNVVYAGIKKCKVSLTNYSDVPNRLVCPPSLI